MEDIYDTIMVCEKCDQKTTKSYVVKNGFKIRIWSCPQCKKKWYHPGDMQDYKEFAELKNKKFEVKLRHVGNSWAVSIPKDIIDFEEVNKTKIVKLCVDEPGKVILFFRKVRKVY